MPDSDEGCGFAGHHIRLTEADLERWRKAFPHLDVQAELMALDEWAGTIGKRWFGAVANVLAKRNREARERADERARMRAEGFRPAITDRTAP